MNRYRIKKDTTINEVIKNGFREGGSWILDDCKLFKAVPLVDEIELHIGVNIIENWDDFHCVLVMDEDFGQPYSAFYAKNYGKEIKDFAFLEKVIYKYNEEMDKISFLERVAR